MTKLTPLQYIKISIANAYGLDKSNWKPRLKFVDEMFETNTEDYCLAVAKEPILMAKAIQAYKDATAGIPTGFLCHLDATSSVFQIMAALIGCHKTAKACNLTDSGNRENAYKEVADEMEYPEKVCKSPTMTSFYGSEANPREVFGDDLGRFKAALEEILPGACEVKEDIQGCWRSDASIYEWSLPDGHTANFKVTKMVKDRIEIDELGHATFTYQREVNEPTKTGISLCANIIQSIDAYIVRMMVTKAKEQGFDLLTIHDCFWASPNHMQQVRENYRDILADIAESNLLQDILRSVTNNPLLTFIKKSHNLADEIRKSDYSLS